MSDCLCWRVFSVGLYWALYQLLIWMNYQCFTDIAWSLNLRPVNGPNNIFMCITREQSLNFKGGCLLDLILITILSNMYTTSMQQPLNGSM